MRAIVCNVSSVLKCVAEWQDVYTLKKMIRSRGYLHKDSFSGHWKFVITATSHLPGTVVTIEGPRFSSKAESRMFRLWGADVINMTTVPEVMACPCVLLMCLV